MADYFLRDPLAFVKQTCDKQEQRHVKAIEEQKNALVHLRLRSIPVYRMAEYNAHDKEKFSVVIQTDTRKGRFRW